ncbi:hypothetical protein F8568_006040 [Actinomadura sp. LD22]|uniref:DUF4760 domain-containing protein n=1 Tax=Actinomadura physcomitrii TaxID=2650748 RepID=A0A6I4MCS8_9ACTN|nr:DUF6082 family protein [Actinomadura physcomitrii]MVZ99945.1 hypothetical protein [Actinomadura physcomitrii]
MPLSRSKRATGSAFLSALGALLVIGLVVTLAFSTAIIYQERSGHSGNRYGLACMAAFAVAALAGVAAFLVIQARSVRITREEARRIAIAELLKMAMDDPALDEAWGPVPEGEDRTARRQLMYINMIVSEWQMSYETKALPEVRLRAISREMFSGRPGRAYWQEARQVRLKTSADKRSRRFHEILDEEYRRAPAPPPETRRSRRRPWALLAATAAGALALAPILRRALTRRGTR